MIEKQNVGFGIGCAFIMASLILFLLPSGNLWAENPRCCLQGIVVDIESNQPVARAVVSLPEQNLQNLTDSTGHFSFPGIRSGQVNIKVKRIGYQENSLNFEIDSSNLREVAIYLWPVALNDKDIIVSGRHIHTKFDELAEYSNVLKGRELQKELSNSLAATLKNESGLAIRSMGPAPARPVIRGLAGDRVLISEDDNKTVDLSATSPDHAVTIEPFLLERMEVIRGPQVLLKTPVTIGGVVNVLRHEIPVERYNGVQGIIGGYGETANQGNLGSMLLQVPVNPIMLRGEFSRRDASDMETPEGRLGNSYADNLDFSMGSSYVNEAGMLGSSFRYYTLDYGIPGGFIGGHPNGVDIEMKKNHNKLKSKLYFDADHISALELDLNRAYYRHKEFESDHSIGSEFRIVDYNGYLNLNYRDMLYTNSGTVGIYFEHRDFDIGGLVFNPPAKSLNLAAYLYQVMNRGRFNLEFGIRYNYDRITPEYEDKESNIGYIREREYNTYSLAISSIIELTSAAGIGASLSKSSRVPTIEELYSEGPHLAAYSYETGNPELNAENGIGLELFTYYNSDPFHFLLTAFYNNLSNFIIPRNTGEINYATFLPVYQSEGVPALLYGLENQMEIRFAKYFGLINTISFTRGKFRDNTGSLPQIPPLNGRTELTCKVNSLSVGLNLKWATRQEKVDLFEEPTAGYTVYGASVQYILGQNKYIHAISVNLDNIFDTEYRNHLSRVKSILPEAGRSLRASYKIYFDM